ncbi:TonB-dependent receptor [uncultured Herbaspirillum sp.]|uniref:TonB-dependent receptor domain-containing protein n=1 Tax=uncultured Herbaspirillum sp. TaxID=160236 RepID=UPI00258D8835|nr:TonB-dependent receptor [uncultured Herbaspirillum sp.]
MKHLCLKPSVQQVMHALTIMFLAAPLVVQAQQATDLGAVSASGTADQADSAQRLRAAEAVYKKAPAEGSLEARSAQSEVSDEFIRNYVSPVADYSQVLLMTPGMYSVSPNGVGLGDTKTSFRGFSDGDYTMTFDGIPFSDTNSSSHHSWAFFPSQFLGGTVVDRSPGSAATVGQANFGGSVNLLSRVMQPQQRTSVFGSYGSFNTRIYGAEFETGQFGTDGAHNLLINAHEMKSDGYQSYNKQQRDAISLKYQFAISDNTALTLFASYIDLKTNTPNTKGATRAQIAQFGDDYLMSGNPKDPNYFGYNFYHVTSDFDYLGLSSNLGGGWKLDDKVYTYAYHNQQNYNGSTISATSATDKLNAYRAYGNLLRLNHESSLGTLRSGLWLEVSNSDRHQYPSSPLTWIDTALPNFRESYTSTIIQPFVEYEFKVTPELKVTPGIKYSSYRQDLTQFADNGKTVGNLGGRPFVKNAATYNTYLPSLDAHYMLRPNWSVYAQFAAGDEIPPTSVFDTKNASVSALPASIKSKTWQTGSVWKDEHLTVDVDAYRIKFDNAYSSFTDNNGFTSYFANGSSTTQGIEAESTLLLGSGFSLYLNATYGSAKYQSGKWVAGAPGDTEAVGLNYGQGPWGISWLNKRVGSTYGDNGNVHEAVRISPFMISNLFANYTIKNPGAMIKQAKLQFGVNNLFDKHNVVGINPASTATSAPAPGDVLTLLPARALSVSLNLDF